MSLKNQNVQIDLDQRIGEFIWVPDNSLSLFSVKFIASIKDSRAPQAFPLLLGV